MNRFCVTLSIAAFCCGCTHTPTDSGNLNSVAWMQTSEEYPALSLGTYNMARQNLDDAREDSTWTALPSQVPTTDEQARTLARLPPAVIVDIDETVLSTLPYQAWLTKNNRRFSRETWHAWVSEASAEAMPGALGFVQHAGKKGVRVFYISNRRYRGPLDRNANGRLDPGEEQVDLEPYTVANLVRLGFLPQPGVSNEDAVLLRGETGEDGRVLEGWDSLDKTARRESLSTDYRILLIIGDDVNDFTRSRYHRPLKRTAASDAEAASRSGGISEPEGYGTNWGRSWFMLPNPLYGSWKTLFFEPGQVLSDEEEIKMKMNRLRTWQ